MPNCNVQNCKSHSGRGEKVTLYSFPKDKQLRERWLVLCRCKLKTSIAHYKFSNKDRVCSIHFAPDAYIEYDAETKSRLDQGLIAVPPRRKLRADAVPTLHMPEASHTSYVNVRSHTEARIARQDAAKNRKRVRTSIIFKNFVDVCSL